MMLKLTLFVFGAFAIYKTEAKCRTIPVFEGNAIVYDVSLGYFRDGRVYYSATEKKVRIIESITPEATRPQFDELLDFSGKKKYLVDLKTRHCKVTDFNVPFRPIEVPDDAFFFGEAQIGQKNPENPGDGVPVGLWLLNINSTEVIGSFSIIETLPECIPVSEVFIGHSVGSKNENYHSVMSFFDVKKGVFDDSVFNPPPECMSEEKSPL